MAKGIRWLSFVALVLVGYLAMHDGWFSFLTDQARVSDYLNSHGPEGLMIVTLAGALYTGIGAPRQLLALVLGFALGGLQGTIISTLATAVGAAGCFWVSRSLLRATLLRHFGKRLDRFDALFREQTWLKVLMVRLLPVGSNLATNLIAGCSGIRFVPFIGGSLLGYLPQTAIFALAGAGIGQTDATQIVVSIVLFALASAIGAFLYHSQRNQTLAEPVSDPS
ncbi:TVP38/TMEM64 family protein [Marinobacter sp. MBR-99]|jgi:uncharacterized membrane protein YdjX (TVP38/TMEM64 family)|uniref:TVP38/TMEM64 family protein n=1 Tax=unclassified Marinobacter TaxID=83889 RepID=UPI00339ACB22